MSSNSKVTYRPELVFGLVGGAGVRLDALERELKDHLATFEYKSIDIRLSALLPNSSDWREQKGSGEYDRIRHYQEMGNALRRRLANGGAVALAGLTEIRAKRSGIIQEAPTALRRLMHTLFIS